MFGFADTYVCPDNVVSNAKLFAGGSVAVDLSRACRTSRSKRGGRPDRTAKVPAAIRSALMKSGHPASRGSHSRAKVVFPAPFGPAMMHDLLLRTHARRFSQIASL